jgi:Tol biopolymer transport system component
VIYSTARGLVLRRLDSLEETPVYTESRLADVPTWSPDGSQVLLRAVLRGLTRLPLNGSPAVIWPQMGITRGLAWAPDGTVLASTIGKPGGGELYLIPASGGKPTRLEVPGFTGGGFLFPEFLPDGKNFLSAWVAAADQGDASLYLATLENGKLTRGPILLRKNTTAGHYSPAGGGKLMYVQNDKLYAQNLNLRRGTLEGEAEQVVDGVFSQVALHRADFSVSRNGVLVWRAGRAGVAQLTWFDRAGAVLGTAGPPCLPSLVRLSQDENHVLVETVGDGAGYSILEPNKSGYTPFSESGLSRAPLWMPDSLHILYGRREGNTVRVMERAAAGGTEKELALVPGLINLRDVSADGKVLLYRVEGTLYSVRLDGSPEEAKPQEVTQTVQGRFSPDGRWVVYSETRSNGTEVYAQPFPSGGLPTQITSMGGEAPIWRGDGREILYRKGATIYAVPVEVKGNTLHAGPPEALFNVRLPAGIVDASMPMAVTRDGSRILFAQGVEQPNPQLTYVMTAWDKALRR